MAILGVDVGGTKIAAGVVSVDGQVTHERRVPTQRQHVVPTIESLVREISSMNDTPIDVVGVAVPELVSLRGEVTTSDVVTWDAERLHSMPWSVHVESDVRAAALAEAELGAGRHYRHSFLYVNVGTGVSASLVIQGEPYAGSSGRALLVSSQVRRDNRWHVVPTEQIGSGAALDRLRETARLDDGDIADAGSAVGASVAVLANFTDPEAMVVGGGLGLAGGPFWDAMTRAFVEGASSPDIPVVHAELASRSPLVGAALTARRRAQQPRGGSGGRTIATHPSAQSP